MATNFVTILFGACAALLFIITIALDQQARIDDKRRKLNDLPPVPAKLTPYVAALTLVALGISFFTSGRLHAEIVATELVDTSCKSKPTLHAPREAAAPQTLLLTLTGVSGCGDLSMKLVFDGTAIDGYRAGDSIVWFTPSLTGGIHAYLLQTESKSPSSAADRLFTGTILAKTALGVGDLETTVTKIFGGLMAIAGLFAALGPIFKRHTA